MKYFFSPTGISNQLIGAMETEIGFLQLAKTRATNENNAKEIVNKIAAIIKSTACSGGGTHIHTHSHAITHTQPTALKQTLLNMGFLAYYKILYKYDLEDEHFAKVLQESQSFEMIYAILLSEREKDIDTKLMRQKCLKSLTLNNNLSNLMIIKCLNLLFRKHEWFDIDVMSLTQIYVYLQSNESGMREETLIFFNNCCRNKERANAYFHFIMEYYPWTNRNKLYMLSCILQTHKLEEFLEPPTSHDSKDFYSGLRLSLNYKHLLPASQYLVKALSKQDSLPLLDLIAIIMTTGSFKEIRNLYTQWFPRIIQKDTLFQLLQDKPEVCNALADFSMLKISSDTAYRFVLIFFIYSRQIMNASKLHFFKISTELITNCFEFEIEAQFLIYKFVAENMCYFALEDCLEFLLKFIRNHRAIDNAQMRSNILGRIPTIINYISKTYSKVQKEGLSAGRRRSNTLDISIEAFYSQLHQTILDDICNKVYQPKIFALKLLDILLKSLYQDNLEKNAKSCNVAQNKNLGVILVSRGIFNASEMSQRLVKALYDPQGFNDALDLIVELIQRLGNTEAEQMIETCRKRCQSVDIDDCALSKHYAKIALSSGGTSVGNGNSQKILYKYAMDMLRSELLLFKADPLYNCKQRSHVFGYLETLNEVLLQLENSEKNIDDIDCIEVLDIIEQIQNMILEFLKSSEEQVYAASFQDMDESLEILVERSEFKTENHEECRKFLLMSFWLTLKASCDLATTLGCHYASKYQEYKIDQSRSDCDTDTTARIDYIPVLKRCFNINANVLTRCRHKGAIEAAGLSLGKLTKYLTSCKQLQTSEINDLIWNCFSQLLDNNGKNVSTTRRGAGYSLMFLHVMKNECQDRGRPLLNRAMAKIFEILASESIKSQREQKNNCDRIEALALHYLCVLVKDAEIRQVICPYYNDIMLAAISKIDDPEWTVCNAALQLFGALVPKVVGQRQATEAEAPSSEWEPTQITYLEILLNMPKTFEYILDYCKKEAYNSTSTRSIILFLGFLNKIEHLKQDTTQEQEAFIFRLRELMWLLIQHPCEKVRKLAAACFVRAHDIRSELPQILLSISDLFFRVRNENFFEGLIFVVTEGLTKMRNEAIFLVKLCDLDYFYETFRENLLTKTKFDRKFKPYTLAKFIDMLLLVGISVHSGLIKELCESVDLNDSRIKFKIGQDEWCKTLKKLNH